MKINDTRTLPAGTKYYEVSEEESFMVGDEPERDWINQVAYTTLFDAVYDVMTRPCRNRLYIDLMEKNPNGNGSAHGLPVFAGTRKQMIESTPYDPKSGWRYTNFDAMGEVAPLPETLKVKVAA